MKKIALYLLLFFAFSACAVFTPRPQFEQGMTENRFLRQNRTALISSMENGKITYRVNRDERFYVLATFEEGVLIRVEEREIVPIWGAPREN
ncbi:MAG: hypothetical protein ACXIT9_08045 [Nitritalea sp.]